MKTVTPDNRKKILVVLSKYFPEYTGPSVRIRNLYSFFEKSYGYPYPRILCGSKDFSESKSYEKDGFNVTRIACIKSQSENNFFRFVAKIKVFIRALIYLERNCCNVDKLHVIGSSPVTHAAVLWSRIKRKYLLLELADRNARLPFFTKFPLLGLDKNASIVVISRELEHYCLSQGLKKRLWYRPNPIDLTRFGSLQIENDKIRSSNLVKILYISSFISRKNQELLVDSMSYLPDNYRLILAGPLTNLKDSEDHFSNVTKLVKKKGLSDRVTIIPEFIDSAEYVQQCDIYALPAFNEGLGTTMLEAIAANKPVVANAMEPAFEEWVENGVNGYLSDPDPHQFAKKIVKAVGLDSWELRSYNSQLSNCFSQEKIFAKYKSILLD